MSVYTSSMLLNNRCSEFAVEGLQFLSCFILYAFTDMEGSTCIKPRHGISF